MRLLPFAVLLLAAAPAVAQQAQLTAESIRRIKATTVYIRVKLPQGLSAGSGFLVKKDEKYGYIATNDHVAAPTTGKLRGEHGTPLAVQGLQVVFNSGTKDEWTAAGLILARDPERDLACVQFAIPKGKELPEPMNPVGVKASETMPVYICGFPFGEMMAEGDKNPEISIGPASVSSVRSDERGEIKAVQINGAINPGNSGGPVVSGEGKLIGVAVASIRGAGLGIAIPQHMVKQMLDGRVGEPVVQRTAGGARVRAVVVDPFNKVRLDKCWIAPAADPGQKSVPNVSSLKQAFPFTPVGRVLAMPNGALKLAQAEFPLAGAVPEVWVQSGWKDADGNIKKGLAQRAHLLSPFGGRGDDDGLGGLPKEVLEGAPGSPPMPGPGAGGGAFAGPGSPADPDGGGGAAKPRPEGGNPRAMPNQPRPNPNPSAPFAGPGRPGKPGPQGPQQPSPGSGPTSPGPGSGKPIAEEEESSQPSPAQPASPQAVAPAMSAPPNNPPARPQTSDDDAPINTKVIYIAAGLMLVAVVGVAGVGAAAMYSGQSGKKPKKRRPSRDWDDDDDDEDYQPRRRR